MRKFNFFYKFLCLLGIFLGLNILNSDITTYAQTIKPPSVSADSAIVIDADTGQVIYSKNGDKKQFPASTTKVMTALLVLENTNLHDEVTVGKKPPYAEGSSIGLKEGEIFTVEDLLTGLMLESGNDCALALAEHIAGSEEEFAKLMNKRAIEIGCKNTNFLNASGLPNSQHITTAYDLSLMLKEAIQYDDFIRIATLPTKKLAASNLDGYERYANNHNHLINKDSKLYYKYALAGKTGYTDTARHTYTVSAKKDGRTLVASFIKAEDKNKNFKEVASLLDFAFNTSENVTLFSKDYIVEELKLTKNNTLPLILEDDFIYTKTASDMPEPKINFDLPNNLKSKSLKKNDLVAKGTVVIDGLEVGQVNILSGKDRTFNASIALKEFFINQPAKALIILGSLLFGLFLIWRIVLSKKDKFDRKRKWRKLTKNVRKN
ncbi:D-alanyl-D-alanine carboxypeptidase family protein [uncultured Clostridium sp.]|uniref:D-alanyl-D-alanine carboxypeptidase family protein n=1 Tax=uncultured Clostridium sp. TaxID=59620 RepID=UPI00262A3A96|nr:D-alanyl-D-alanine carboxypeptidase family protein [uncultured Clostridium sp.]